MKDLDFDELDKAVNSLMAGVKSDDAPASDKEKTLTIGTSASSPSRSGSPTTPPPRPATLPVASPGQPAPAARRGGRFMDVVHPSSDMKKPETPVRSSREGVTIEPRTEAGVAPAPSDSHDTGATSTSVSAEAVKKEETPATPSVQPHHETGDWPDPLDMVPTKPEESKASEADSPSVPANMPPVFEESENKSPWREATSKAKEMPAKVEPEPEVETEAKPTDDVPLVSPFLPDTKVEKRPLGANATSPGAADDLLVVDENAQLPANPKDVEPVLPAELHGDVMAIESDTTTKQASAAETPKPTDENDSPWKKPDDQPEKPVASLKPEGPAPAEVKREEPKITGPTSIAQQYHEEPSTGDQKNGAIYDTDTYHQPLSHPAKKKSGWMWIVWILLIVVVGAGAGAAIYFLGIV